ncbi:unnamed protein product [Clonostachys rosea]|uniref:Nudix hydrolase domain-containing protein n=1 Tax=Bionectria ochroleuca TaxID=29856 RepID=A0ABY6U8Y4_BIOOC|nr:unnamed protein product [Clonostachys rosea]
MATISKTFGTKNPSVTYTERQAVRVVAFNSSGNIALIYAKRDSYYKLPGGGIDSGEDRILAAQREMMEETGATVRVREGGCIATAEEFRDGLHQISFCYIADLLDESNPPSLTEDEIQDGLQHQWLPLIDAKKAMAAAEPTSALGSFIKERDIFLLDQATKKQTQEIQVS